MSAYYWMDWLMHIHDIKIQHKLNFGREVVVGKYPVDGYRPPHSREKSLPSSSSTAVSDTDIFVTSPKESRTKSGELVDTIKIKRR